MADAIDASASLRHVTQIARSQNIDGPSVEHNRVPESPSAETRALVLDARAEETRDRRIMMGISEGLSMLQLAERARTVIADDIFTLHELAAVGTIRDISPALRDVIGREVPHVLERIDFVANNASYRGMPLINGTLGEMQLQIGTGETDFATLSFDSLTAEALGLDNASVATTRDAESTVQAAKQALNTTDRVRTANGALRDDLISAIDAGEVRSIELEELIGPAGPISDQGDKLGDFLRQQSGLARQVQSSGIDRIHAQLMVD